MNPLPENTIREINELLSYPRNIAILIHYNPDGDAIGSALGLYSFLIKQRHTVSIITPNSYPKFLKWLPNNDKITHFKEEKEKSAELFQNADIIFCLDFIELSRAGDALPYLTSSKAKKIVIDHHPGKNKFADYVISDVTVSAAAELVYEFMNSIDNSLIDRNIAECIFTGIMTDTGCFSFNSSQPRTYEIISKLLDYGINKDQNFSNIYDNYSADRMRLLGFVLSEKMVVSPEHKAAYISLTQEELKQFNFKIGDSEGFVNYPLSIKGIVFSALFMENKNHVKASFRSKGMFDVNQFARKNFEGGGHVNASGGKSYANMEDTLKRFEELLPLYTSELNNDLSQ